MGDPTSLAWWLEKFGPTGAILFFIALAAWRILVWSGKRLDELIPLFKQLLLGHISLMDTMKVQLAEGHDTLKKVSEMQDEHGSKLDAIHKAVSK